MATPRGATSTIAVRVGRAIAIRRRALKLTQAQIAEAVNVEQQTVSRWESGIRTPSLETLEQLAVLLDCTVVDFLSDLADRDGYQHLVMEDALRDLTEQERILTVRHLQQFTALLREQRQAMQGAKPKTGKG